MAEKNETIPQGQLDRWTLPPFVPAKDRKPLTKEQKARAARTFQEILNAPPGYTNATEEEKRAHPDMFKD